MDKKNKAVVTVVGNDTIGIIARVSAALAAHNANILDISQTVLSGMFNMMMIVDVSLSDFDTLSAALSALGAELGLQVRIQRSEALRRDAPHLMEERDDQYIRNFADGADDYRGKARYPHDYDGHFASMTVCIRIRIFSIRTSTTASPRRRRIWSGRARRWNASSVFRLSTSAFLSRPRALWRRACGDPVVVARAMDAAAEGDGRELHRRLHRAGAEGHDRPDRALIASLPEALSTTERVCSSGQRGVHARGH